MSIIFYSACTIGFVAGGDERYIYIMYRAFGFYCKKMTDFLNKYRKFFNKIIILKAHDYTDINLKLNI